MNDSMWVAVIGGAFSLLVAVVPKIIDYLCGTKKKLDKLTTDVEDMKKMQDKMGDIIYQMLDHMVTNNNTGNMKKCLDDYNQFSRHK